jgi:hypothetical protein
VAKKVLDQPVVSNGVSAGHLVEQGRWLNCPRPAEVAQLVERNLAKVEVAGSSPVFRSTDRRFGRPAPKFGDVAEWLGAGLQNPLLRFNSGRRLRVERPWALSSGVERFPDTEEVSGSNPLGPTLGHWCLPGEIPPGMCKYLRGQHVNLGGSVNGDVC